MTNDPQIAIQDMKLALDSVKRAPDLSPEKRAELVDNLEVALKEARHQAFLEGRNRPGARRTTGRCPREQSH